MQVLSFAGIKLDPESISHRLHVSDKGVVERLIESVRAAISPQVAFQISYLDEKRDDWVVVDGVRFSSRVLRRNLDGVGRVFPFVLTLGKAVDEIIEATEDMLEKYLLDQIGNMALRKSRGRFDQHLRSTFALEKISFMAPGSLEDWPIEQQKPLFELLPEMESAIGVRLTSSFLMIPRKTVSGIYFPSGATFLSCQLCPRVNCEGRKAPYDKEKAREYGVLKE